jgi:TctA family transporter
MDAVRSAAPAKYSCKPALATTSLFVALFIVDLIRQEYAAIIGHALLGVFSILLVNVLCQNNMSYVAWGLLVTPFILIGLGYLIFMVQQASREPVPAPPPAAPPKLTPAPVKPAEDPKCCPPPPSPYKYYM